MRLIRRYLLRQLTGPFLYALAGLTGFMLLNQVARRFGQLVGKGLEWTVIAEVFALSLPFIVAMTLPMAVLVAVLYTFSHLAADNEVTAMRAGGLSVLQILAPVVLWGALTASANFVFVDQVLPRSNARLKALLTDIYRKKPTFELHEQVINNVPPSQYFLRAGRIEAGTGRLRDVVIYDVGDQTGRRIIYADSGLMGLAPGQRDLSLLLYDGAVHELKTSAPSEFRLTYFRTNRIRVRNVFDELERNTNTSRGDREMSTCEMLGVVRLADRQRRQAELDRDALLDRDLRTLVGLGPRTAGAPAAERPLPRYCTLGAVLAHRLGGTAKPPPPAQAARPAPIVATPGAVLATWSDVASLRDRITEADGRGDRYLVEVHKKWSISAACITFVLMGIVLALRFPRGGIGLVVGGGFGIFAVFYVFLTAGEALADRGIVEPALAMWGPNLIFILAGIIGLVVVNRETGSTRGGDFQEIIENLRAWLRRRRRSAA